MGGSEFIGGQVHEGVDGQSVGGVLSVVLFNLFVVIVEGVKSGNL